MSGRSRQFHSQYHGDAARSPLAAVSDPAAAGRAAWVDVGAAEDGFELGATLVAVCETEPLSPALPIRTLTLTLIVPAAGVVDGADGAVRAAPSPTVADAVLSVVVSGLSAVVSGSDPPVDAGSASHLGLRLGRVRRLLCRLVALGRHDRGVFVVGGGGR